MTKQDELAGLKKALLIINHYKNAFSWPENTRSHENILNGAFADIQKAIQQAEEPLLLATKLSDIYQWSIGQRKPFSQLSERDQKASLKQAEYILDNYDRK